MSVSPFRKCLRKINQTGERKFVQEHDLCYKLNETTKKSTTCSTDPTDQGCTPRLWPCVIVEIKANLPEDPWNRRV